MIKVHQDIDPNSISEVFGKCVEIQNRDAYACFIVDQWIWRKNISENLDTLPHLLSWHLVVDETELGECEITGLNCEVKTWELRL